MTKEERQAARERERKATPGPWAPYDNIPMPQEDAEFCAHARTDLPAALDALDAAEARIAELAHFERRWAEAVREVAERDAEIARLRAALERIADNSASPLANRISREALKGGA